MKIKLISLLFALGFFKSVTAQLPINEENGRIEYIDVIQLENISKNEIYQKAKLWVVSTLKSGDNMVELDGTTSDQIIGTGNIELYLDPEMNKTKNKLKLERGHLNFKFIVFCKEGRLKYEIKNFSLYFTRDTYGYREISTNLETSDIVGIGKNQTELFKDYAGKVIDNNIRALISDFKSNLQSVEEDNW